jgi:hypothetical protein
LALDCPVKVYTKRTELGVTCCLEASLKNVNIDNIYRLFTDFDLMSKREPKLKKLVQVEKTSKNSDVIYAEIDLPFPMTNREFLSQRLYLSNKDDSDLIRQFGLYTKEHRYFVLLQKSTERPDYPEKSKPVRADIKLICWLVEEDPTQTNTVRIKQIMCQDMKGNLTELSNKASPQAMQDGIGQLFDNYRKLIGKV